MASKPLNSSNGFSVGSNGNVIIDSAGNITTDSIIVAQYANLGNIANVKITGGSNGQAIVTDGAGNLVFANSTSSGNLFITSPMPFLIPSGETNYVTANHQGLFSQTIEVDGTLQVDGILEDVSLAPIISVWGNITGGNLNTSGVVSATGNITSVGNIAASYFIGNGSQLTGINATTSNITNGSSNVVAYINGNVAVSVSSLANIAVFTTTGAVVSGTLSASGNITGGNLTLSPGGVVSYTPGTPSNWANPAPTSLQEAIDRLAAVVKTLNGGTGA